MKTQRKQELKGGEEGGKVSAIVYCQMENGRVQAKGFQALTRTFLQGR